MIFLPLTKNYFNQQSSNQQFALNLTQNLAVLNLVSPDGPTLYGNHNIPNHHAFTVLKKLLSIDSTISDKAATQTALEQACFPTDDDEPFNHLKIAAFIEQTYLQTHPPAKYLNCCPQNTWQQPTTMVLTFRINSKFSNRKQRERTIALQIDPQHPN